MQQTRRFGVVDLILTSSGGFSQSSHQSGCIRCTVSSEEDHPSPVATSPSVQEWPRGPGDSIQKCSTTEAQSLDGSSSCLFTTRSGLSWSDLWLRGGSNSCHVTRGVGLPARLRMRIFSCVQAGGSCRRDGKGSTGFGTLVPHCRVSTVQGFGLPWSQSAVHSEIGRK